jgi:hypothetical protein
MVQSKMKLHHSKLMPFHGQHALEHFDFEPYNPETDKDEPAQFWLYSAEDYRIMQAHRAEKFVFWHGIDVLYLLQNKERLLRNFREANPVCACHNKHQQKILSELGIYAKIRPWFINDIEKYKPSENRTKQVFMSSHVDREEEYGEPMINTVAAAMPDWTFHIFGSHPTMPMQKNVIHYGQVHEEVMDGMTEDHAATIRWKHYDGVAQTVMKALLRGQMAITALEYPFTYCAADVEDIIFLLSHHETLRGLPKIELNNFDWMEGV